MNSPLDLKANLRVRVYPNKCVRVKRTLPGKIKVTVLKNQEVAPHDILGSSSISAGFSSINLSKELSVTPAEALKYLQRPIGETFFKGELLASKKGFFSKKNILTPTDCIAEGYDQLTGELRIKFLPKERPLVAGVYGIVDSVNQQTGEILIRTLVTQVKGLYGTGGERSGFLNIINQKDQIVPEAQINQDMKGRILVAGALIYGEALRKASGFGVSGIISGGLNADSYKSMSGSIYPGRSPRDVGISVIATEGFGLLPIGDDIFNLLSPYEGRFVFIDGNKAQILLPSQSSDCLPTLRKIALPQTPQFYPDDNLFISDIKLGNKVRIIWPPFMGAQGKVAGIDQTATVLESGISTYMLTVETTLKKIKVPFTNIELI